MYCPSSITTILRLSPASDNPVFHFAGCIYIGSIYHKRQAAGPNSYRKRRLASSHGTGPIFVRASVNPVMQTKEHRCLYIPLHQDSDIPEHLSDVESHVLYCGPRKRRHGDNQSMRTNSRSTVVLLPILWEVSGRFPAWRGPPSPATISNHSYIRGSKGMGWSDLVWDVLPGRFPIVRGDGRKCKMLVPLPAAMRGWKN